MIFFIFHILQTNPRKSLQLIPILPDLPGKYKRCGAKTKRAGHRKRKKTAEIIYRVICTNNRCNASHANIQDKTQMIDTAVDELVMGRSLREIASILDKKYSNKYSHVGIIGWLKKHQKLVKTTQIPRLGMIFDLDKSNVMRDIRYLEHAIKQSIPIPAKNMQMPKSSKPCKSYNNSSFQN